MRDQLEALRSSWAYRKRDLQVFWVSGDNGHCGRATAATSSKSVALHDLLRSEDEERFNAVAWNRTVFPCGGLEPFEHPALLELHSFCRRPQNTANFVAYMHTKSDSQERRDLMKGRSGSRFPSLA